MLKLVWKFSLMAVVTGCGILVPQSGNLQGDVLELLDSARAHPIVPQYDYLARPDSISFDRPGKTQYQYRCTSDHSRGGLGPDYVNQDLIVTRMVTDPVKMPITYSDSGAPEASFGYIFGSNTYDSLLTRPRVESAYQTAFRDDSGKYVVVYRSSGFAFTQVFREGTGLIYDATTAYSGGMDSDWRRCVLTRVNDTDFDAHGFLSKLVGMASSFAEVQSKDSTLMTVKNCQFDSLTLTSRIGRNEDGRHGLCMDTTFRFLQSEFFSVMGYDENGLYRYFLNDKKLLEVNVEGLQIDLVTGAPYYAIHF